MKREKCSLRAAWELQMDGGLQGEGCIPRASAGEPGRWYGTELRHIAVKHRVWGLWLKHV